MYSTIVHATTVALTIYALTKQLLNKQPNWYQWVLTEKKLVHLKNEYGLIILKSKKAPFAQLDVKVKTHNV